MYWRFWHVLRIFQSTCVIETGLSDFHLVIVTVMSGTFKKMRPRVINYRSCRDSSNETFRVSLINNLSNEIFVISDDGLEKKLQNNHGYQQPTHLLL